MDRTERFYGVRECSRMLVEAVCLFAPRNCSVLLHKTFNIKAVKVGRCFCGTAEE